MRRPVDTYTRKSQRHGQPTIYSSFGKHTGVDYAGPEGRLVKSPVDGVIVKSYLSGQIGNTYEIKENGNGRLHRLAHLKTRPLGYGTNVREGQVIGVSGGAKGEVYSGKASTGPHVHWDVRKAGTAWNESFENYYDPEKLLKPEPKTKKAAGHPLAWAVGKDVYLPPTDSTWRVYTVGSVPPRAAKATLNPVKYGGLWYRVLGTEKAKNSVRIRTQMFGEVSCPIARDQKGNLYKGVKVV